MTTLCAFSADGRAVCPRPARWRLGEHATCDEHRGATLRQVAEREGAIVAMYLPWSPVLEGVPGEPDPLAAMDAESSAVDARMRRALDDDAEAWRFADD